MTLAQTLTTYLTTVSCPAEKMSVLRCIHFLKETAQPFHRENLAGHMTASACIVSSDQSQLVLLHHAKLNKWLQPGGHCDGNSNTEAVARQEAKEETGLMHLRSNGEIFDVDVHWIPRRKEVPGHWHYDIRYLFLTHPDHEILQKNEESNQVAWVPGAALVSFTQESSIRRMWEKLGNIDFSTFDPSGIFDLQNDRGTQSPDLFHQ